MRLILASASPRRAELLRAAGYTFEVMVAHVDESIRPGESPSSYVRRLAAEKSAHVAADLRVGRGVGSGGHSGPPPHEIVVLGADTTVVVGGEILAKPLDDADGAGMLRRLSGKTHEVLTGISLRCNAYEVGRVETTTVSFRPLTDEDIAWYVQSGEGRDKAGGYAIQGLASRFIPSISGSYANVVGLPVAAIAELLPEIRHQMRKVP